MHAIKTIDHQQITSIVLYLNHNQVYTLHPWIVYVVRCCFHIIFGTSFEVASGCLPKNSPNLNMKLHQVAHQITPQSEIRNHIRLCTKDLPKSEYKITSGCVPNNGT